MKQLAILSTFRTGVAKNTSWLLSSQVVSLGAQVVYFFILARLLGSEQYGIYVAASALVSLISQYGTLGAGVVFLRYVSADREKARVFWGNITLSSCFLGPTFVVVIAIAGHLILHNGQFWLVTIVALSDCLCGSLVMSVSQMFQAFEEMRTTALLNLTGNLMRLALACYLLAAKGHSDATVWAVAVLVSSVIVTILASVLAIRRVGYPQISLAHLIPYLWEGFVFAFSTSTVAVYNDVDKTIMGHLGMNEANGAYSLAYKIINIATLPLTALYSALTPRFFRVGADGIRATLPLVKRVIGPTVLIGAAAAVLIFLFSPFVVPFAGKDFATAAPVLRWLCAIPLLRNFQWCAGDALVGAGFVNTRVAIQVGVSILNLAAGLYLIPRYSWMGATWASVGTDALLALTLWLTVFWLCCSKPSGREGHIAR